MSPRRNASSKLFGGTGEILVLGQVNSPGSYTVVGGKTTVLDAVVKAGSFTKNADLTSVVITHRGITNAKGIATGTRVNLDRVIMNADMSQNIVLNPEDMVYVPEKVVSDKLGPGDILVLGQVNFPGIYGVAASKPTILNVIALAGGFTPSAILSSVIVIHRAKTNAKGIATAVRIDLNRMIMHADMSQNIVLSAQDLVYVPEKFIANLNYFLSQVFNPITGAAQTAVNLRKLTW